MSAAERSPPCAEQSPAMRARIASPLREAYMRPSSAPSSTEASAPCVAASDSVGCAAARPGSIHVRYALSITPGFSASAPRPSKTLPVTVK